MATKDSTQYSNANKILFLRGTKAENDAYTGSSGEITVDTTTNSLRVHDGTTKGGTVVGDISNGITTATVKTTSGTKTSTGFKIADDTDLANIFTQDGITSASVATSGSGTYVRDVTVTRTNNNVTITKTLGTPISSVSFTSDAAVSNGGTFLKNLTLSTTNGVTTLTRQYGTPTNTNTHCTYCGYCTYCTYCQCSSAVTNCDCGSNSN